LTGRLEPLPAASQFGSFRKSHRVIIPLTVHEILEEPLVRKLA
jgi:hypothetical protein